MYNFMSAFVICGLVLVIGEVVAKKTRAWVPSVFVSAATILIFYWTFVPTTLLTDAKLMPFAGTLAIFLLLVHLGTIIHIKVFLQQWRTVTLCLAGLVGMCVLAYYVCPLLMDRELVIAGLPPLSGGIIATTMMQEAALKHGLEVASVFAVTIFCVQGFAGYPLTSLCLRKEGEKLLKEYRAASASADPADMAAIKEVMKLPEDKKGILSTPEWLNSPFFSLTKVGFVAFLATQVAPFTGISAAVWALVLGVGACALGFLESNVLVKANSMQILMFALMMFVFDGLKVCTPEMLVNLIVPSLVLIGAGLAGMAVFAIGACFVLKVSPWLGFANALTALYGFPFNQILTEQICDQLAKTPEERDYLMSRMFPSMIVGGFVTVTVASVVIAGFFVDMF